MTVLSCLENVRHGHGAVPADGLRQGAPRALDLVRSRLSAKLEGGLDDLVRATRPHRVAAGLQPAEGRDGNATAGGDAALGGEAQRLAAPGVATGLERERGDDRERVVGLEEVHV